MFTYYEHTIENYSFKIYFNIKIHLILLLNY